MSKIISGLFGFIETTIIASLIGSGVCLLAGEVRLAALKKASKGSSKLSKFTERMTGTKLFQD
jgi:hypothetical protein